MANTPDRFWRGQIDYTSDSAHDRGRRRGVEHFIVSLHNDGTRILRATSFIDDPPHVVRDCVHRADAEMRPLDAYVSIRTGGVRTGSAWFRWDNGVAECEADTVTAGRFRQSIPYGAGPLAFCDHAIVGDAWMAANYPIARGPGIFLCAQMFTTTVNKQGATGPELAKLVIGFEYKGRQQITVKAGTFETRAFRFCSAPSAAEWKAEDFDYEMWTLTDGSYIAVQSMYRGRRKYELVALVQE